MPYKDKARTVANVKKWRQENRERYFETTRVWRLANKEKLNQLATLYREKNRENDRRNKLRWYYRNKGKCDEYRKKNRDKYNEYSRNWAKRNREYLALQRSQYRAKQKELGFDLTYSQWEAIKRAYNFKCAYCGTKPQRLEKDHVIPIAKGGATTSSNIIPSCKHCNRQKSVNEPTKLPALRLFF